MAYRLPPPWDPGYALPDNVRDEGLQRRAFVTRQMPRGTYDDPRVGTGGYVVPKYVKDEGYGQGTLTTKWQPRGTYNGPRVPHWLNKRPALVEDRRRAGGGRTLEFALSGTPYAMDGISGEMSMPPEYESYGRQAAAVLMRHVNRLPVERRKPELRRIMNAIDGSLYTRTAEIATRYHRQGVPAPVALERGIARAMSTGIAAEIIQTGRTRQLPAARSLLGMGCYGCGAVAAALGQGALGAAVTETLGALGAVSSGAIAQLAAPNLPIASSSTSNCGNPPAGFTWDAGFGTFRKLRAGEAPTPGPQAICIQQWGDNKQTGTAPPPPRATTGTMIEVGPWVFEDKPGATVRVQASWWNTRPDLLAKTVAAVKSAALLFRGSPAGSSGAPGAPAIEVHDAMKRMFPRAAVASLSTTNMSVPALLLNGQAWPIFQTTHPVTGKKMGLYIKSPGTTETPTITLEYKEIPQNWLSKIVDFVVMLVSKIIEVVGDVLENLDGLACALVNAPGIKPASAAIGGPAGAAGAGLAAGACNQPYPPMPPPSNLGPILVMGGVAVAAVLILTKKKKAPTTP